MNPFRLAKHLAVELVRGSILAVHVILASAAARLDLPLAEGTGVGPRESGDLIRPTKASQGGTCPVPSNQHLCVAGERRLFASPDSFRAKRTETGRPTVAPKSTPAFSDCFHLPVARINPHLNHGNPSRPQ